MNLTCLMICGFMLTVMGFWYWSWGFIQNKNCAVKFIICCQESCDPRIDGCLPFYLRDNILNIILLIFFLNDQQKETRVVVLVFIWLENLQLTFMPKGLFYDGPHLLNDLQFYAKQHGIMVMVLGLFKKKITIKFIIYCHEYCDTVILFNYLQ